MIQERSQAPEAPECHPSPRDGKAAAKLAKGGHSRRRYPITRHGTRTSYLYGCRCARCTEANTLYQRQRKADPAPKRIPIARAKRHLERLARLGYTRDTIAESSSVDRTMVYRIMSGRCSFLHRETEARILALSPQTLEFPDGAHVDATPLLRRVEQFVERGYNRKELSRMLGFCLYRPDGARIRAGNLFRTMAILDKIEAGEIRR